MKPRRNATLLVKRIPWMRREDHARLLDGLRKASWQG
jgi:hypothetical protein